jgi:hypothetical protein
VTKPFKNVFEDTENVPLTVRECKGLEVLIPMFELNKRTLLSDLHQYILLLAKVAVLDVFAIIGYRRLLVEVAKLLP